MTKSLTKKAIVIMLLQWLIFSSAPNSSLCRRSVLVMSFKKIKHLLLKEVIQRQFAKNIWSNSWHIHRKFLDGRAMKLCTLDCSMCFNTLWCSLGASTRKICKIKYRILFWQVMHFYFVSKYSLISNTFFRKKLIVSLNYSMYIIQLLRLSCIILLY